MPRVALSLAYDGADWLGWQTQPQRRTVQDAFEQAAAQFLAHPVSSICAGRTDTGVHAVSQVVHVDTEAQRTPVSWVRGLNALLPPSIAVQWAASVGDDFHARFSALSRTYVYVVRCDGVRSPLTDRRAGWVHRPLRLAPMQQAAAFLLGEHDFSSFRSSQCQAASPVRVMRQLQIAQDGGFFFFRFTANAFLHHMVRNLMGALLYVGMGRQEPEWLADLLAQRDRRRAAPTFSAHGLYLVHVDYPGDHELPAPDWPDAFQSLTGWRLPPQLVVG